MNECLKKDIRWEGSFNKYVVMAKKIRWYTSEAYGIYTIREENVKLKNTKEAKLCRKRK